MFVDVLRKWGGCEVSAMEVYSDMFKLGEGYIQFDGEPCGSFKANPIGYYRDKGMGHYRIFFEDTFEEILKEMQGADDFAILNGLSYFGRKNLQDHASKMYAMIFDLDGVTDETLNTFLNGSIVVDAYPLPNYIILSGHGIHLYYLFEEPLSLYPYMKIQLKELKYALTDKIWNKYTSTEEKKQFQGINQGFRVIGGRTKTNAPESIVRAFRMNTHPFSLSQLCKYVPDEKKIDESKLWKENKMSLEQAKKKYPEWYQKVILNKDKTRKYWDIAGKVHGNNPYALYDWWKRNILVGATYGHRYFAIMALAIYGIKNDVPLEKVRKDAEDLIPFLNGINPEYPFLKSDCDVALECYDQRYRTFPIDDLIKITGIPIKKNKRNGRKQLTHLKIARSTLAIMNEDEERPLQGRPKASSKQKEIVWEWRRSHPNGKKSECISDTGVSKPTVYRWWDMT